MLKRKTTKIMISVLSLFVIGSTSAFAASYYFNFEGSFVGSIQHSFPRAADGNFTPYVYPNGTTNATSYVLTKSASNSTSEVSNFRTNITSGKHNFTYKKGFGGSGQDYKMTGYPSNSDFQDYKAAGTWKP